MLISVLWTTLAGFTRSFAPSYLPFIILEFLDTLFGAGFYGAAFVLGIAKNILVMTNFDNLTKILLAMELVTPDQRVIGNTILACAFVAGEIILGLAAWISPSWRIMLRITYGPGIFFISYFWLTHESVRWLLSKGSNQKAKQILKKVAKVNGAQISEETIAKLNQVKEKDSEEESVWHIFQSPKLLLRLLNCSYSWICCTFVYYGLTLHSVSISGNMYVNYIAVAAIEIPAFFLCNYTLSRLGRRLTLAPSYILSGIACLSFIFVPSGLYFIYRKCSAI